MTESALESSTRHHLHTGGVELRCRVGVIIPCYRQAHFLPFAVKSVCGQGGTDVQIIVVNDGSPDNPAAAIAEILSTDSRVRVVNQANAGLAAARNRGAGELAADRDYLLFLDSDDVLEPGALETLALSLEGHPQAPAAHGVARSIDEHGLPAVNSDTERLARERWVIQGGRLRPLPRGAATTFETLAYRNCISSPGQVLLRRSAVEEAGLFDISNSPVADWDLWLRLSLRGPIAFVDRLTLSYRTHGGSMSKNHDVMRRADLLMRRRLMRTLENDPARSRTALCGFKLGQQLMARAYLSVALGAGRRGRALNASRMLARAAFCQSNAWMAHSLRAST